MSAVRVIGVGSPFGSDRAGWEVIDHLQNSPEIADDCELVKLDRPASELLTYLEADRRTIIIDAIQGPFRKGEVVVLQKEDFPGIRPALSSHGIGLAEALRLAETLQQLPADLVVVGLEVGNDANWTLEDSQVKALARQVIACCGHMLS